MKRKKCPKTFFIICKWIKKFSHPTTVEVEKKILTTEQTTEQFQIFFSCSKCGSLKTCWKKRRQFDEAQNTVGKGIFPICRT